MALQTALTYRSSFDEPFRYIFELGNVRVFQQYHFIDITFDKQLIRITFILKIKS